MVSRAFRAATAGKLSAKIFPSTFLVQASKAPRVQMNFNLPSLPWQVSHSPGVSAVIRHSTFETGWTARQVLGAHPKNNAVCCLLHSLQDIVPTMAANSKQGQYVGSPLQLIEHVKFSPSRPHRKCGRSVFFLHRKSFRL